jgi:hypothetical protein
MVDAAPSSWTISWLSCEDAATNLRASLVVATVFRELTVAKGRVAVSAKGVTVR